jgi:four helix bundle protein
MDEKSHGGHMTRKEKNRGYQKLRVWNDALDYYVETYQAFRGFPYELRRVAMQAIASTDSAHRNIAEGYCRRSIREYLNFLNIALGSLGESVSGLYA